MKLKKWLFGTVLSFCLLMNTLAMPAASAGVLDEFAEKNFPTIVALQDEYKNKSAVLDGMEYLERWREYATIDFASVFAKLRLLVKEQFALLYNDIIHIDMRVKIAYATTFRHPVAIYSFQF